MRKYISELHTKPRAHKKRFAFLASAVVTLSIFAVWSSVKFGVKPVVVRSETGAVNLASVSSQNGLDKIFDSLKNSWKNIVTSDDK